VLRGQRCHVVLWNSQHRGTKLQLLSIYGGTNKTKEGHTHRPKAPVTGQNEKHKMSKSVTHYWYLCTKAHSVKPHHRRALA
jgi:hypothetical protein